MASMMKQLMDKFDAAYRRSLSKGEYTVAFVYQNAENLANNCHGKTNEQIAHFLSAALTGNMDAADSDAEKDAYADCLRIIDEMIPA